MKKIILFLFLLTSCGSPNAFDLKSAKVGLWVSLASGDGAEMTVDQWNNLIDNFNVEAVAEETKQLGASYVIFPIGGHSGFYTSPNAVFESIVGNHKTAKRDLVSDLQIALARRGIALIVYMDGIAPIRDVPAAIALGFDTDWRKWTCTGEMCEDIICGLNPCDATNCQPVECHDEDGVFNKNWNAVVREYSQRWGNRIAGWWVDESYGWSGLNRDDVRQTILSGNPNTIIAFNVGYRCDVVLTDPSDFTAGEIRDTDCVHPSDGIPSGAYHVTSYAGEFWGGGNPRYSNEEILKLTKMVNDQGGPISWDVPRNQDGTIKEPFLQQLKFLRDNLN